MRLELFRLQVQSLLMVLQLLNIKPLATTSWLPLRIASHCTITQHFWSPRLSNRVLRAIQVRVLLHAHLALNLFSLSAVVNTRR